MKFKTLKYFWFGVASIPGFLGILSCSSVPEKASTTHESILRAPPKEISDSIELSFRRRLALFDAQSVNLYLSRLALKIIPPGRTPPSVFLVSSQNSGLEPSVWVVPGGAVFFDIRILRVLKFENEVAAAIALAWERSEGHAFRERFVGEASQPQSDPEKIWVFSDLENETAIEGAVDRMYKAGYDPRGLVAYFDRTPSKTKTQIEPENESLKTKTRRAITFYAPLLNPIVGTESFQKMKKELERL